MMQQSEYASFNLSQDNRSQDSNLSLQQVQRYSSSGARKDRIRTVKEILWDKCEYCQLKMAGGKGKCHIFSFLNEYHQYVLKHLQTTQAIKSILYENCAARNHVYRKDEQ